MKKILLLISIICTSLNISTAQVALGGMSRNNLLDSKYTTKAKKNALRIEGGTTLFEEDKTGYLILEGNEKSDEMKVNYDLLTKTVNVTFKGEAYSVDNRFVDTLLVMDQLGPRVFKFVKTEDGDVMMEVIVEGEFPLLKAYTGSLVRPNYNDVLQTGNKYHTVKRRDDYYLLGSENTAIPLPNKSKKILSSKAFSTEFKNIVKKENPKMKNEKALVKFFIEANQDMSI